MFLVQDNSNHEEAEEDVPGNDNDVVESQSVWLSKPRPNVEAGHDSEAHSCNSQISQYANGHLPKMRSKNLAMFVCQAIVNKFDFNTTKTHRT